MSFVVPTVVPRVVSKPIHEVESGPISVCAHYEPLGTIAEMDFTTSSTKPMDKTNIHRAIKRNEQKIVNVDLCKLRLLEKQLPPFRSAFPNVDFDVIQAHREVRITGVEQEVEQAHGKVKGKLDEFKESRWSIPTELRSVIFHKDTKKIIDSVQTQTNTLNDVIVDVRNKEVAIWAVDKGTADTAENSIRALFTETSRDVSKEVLGVGGWDNFAAQSNKDANFSAVMSCDKNAGKVKISGLIQAVDVMEKKLDDFLKQVDTSVVSVDEAVLNVLAKGQKDLIQKIESANEVKIDVIRAGFKILGPRDRMKKVSEAIMDLVSNVIKIKEHHRKPGMKRLFSKDTFQKRLKEIEENQRCSLQWDSKTQPQALATEEKPSKIILQPPTPSAGHQSVGPITIDIQPGHLESESTDVIVNPVTSGTAFTVVGDALEKAGGQSIRDDFQTNWGSRVNGVLLTDAGTLRCKKVAHMVLPPADKLSDAVCQCLVLSNQAGMTSIAFPAIGTGGFGLNPSQSAKAIRAGVEQFVRQNPAPVLKTVKLTIFTQRMVADYTAEFRSNPSRPAASAKGKNLTRPGNITTTSSGQKEMSFGSVRMQVQQGDISQEKTDVVVSTLLKDMGFTVVTKALVKAGGQSIADDLKKTWPKKTDKLVFTDAGKLASRKVAHMVLPSASELKESVLACLKTADKLGMKSISFPAIGTGGSMSQAESAHGIYSGVQEFGSQLKPQNLKLVRVTIYDSKMLGTFHSTLQQFSIGGHVPATQGSPSGQFGSVTVQIQQGDLTKETTDAVVNPVNSDGGFFAVGLALEKAGDSTVKTDCPKSWNERMNDVLVKDGGKLQCKKIIHMACPDAKAMKGRVLECLQQAERNGLTSVAFPAIGTGGFGVSAADAARETVQAIKDFAGTHNPRSVKLVRVTVFQASMVAEFQQALQAAHPKAPIAGVAAVEAIAPVVTPVGKMPPNTDVEQVVEVTFFACNQVDMDNAKREVSKTIDSFMTNDRVNDDRLKSTVRLLQQIEKDSIIQMGTDQLVLVTITGSNIEVSGLSEEVEGVLKEIGSFLREKKAAYDAEELKKDVIKVPDHWATPPSGTTCAHIVSLLQSSQEYKDVEKKFLASVGYKPQIVSISRVQNEAKYKAYMLELKEREKRLGTGSTIEKVLYHGTAQDVVVNINEGGFNRSYCGKNATVYGKGMYFARDASYSAQPAYSPPDSQGNRHIYQVRVIVGEYTTGKSGIVEPPPKNPSNVAVRYDSVVDNVQNPSIFVVFRDNEAYPEYLIVFK
ncbi:protein mono-ADP-ribosyltransferase PARP14-like [Branchiostoma lanceolatum]|uniref:protein mono-ADP-ribosyltransferase PARP14-like n=1 Tax=Branchiostoma lanceolatum TaxID=7740 RepID=UPI0034546119